MKSSWNMINNALVREFTFKDFNEALVFINKVGAIAEKHQHHPEIVNVYSHVTLRLTTHDAGNKITEKDLKLAKAIDELK